VAETLKGELKLSGLYLLCKCHRYVSLTLLLQVVWPTMLYKTKPWHLMYFAAPPMLDMKSSLTQKTHYIIYKKRFICHKQNTQAEINTRGFSPLTEYLKSTTKKKTHIHHLTTNRHTKLATGFLSQSSACPQLQNILPWGSLFIAACIVWPPAFPRCFLFMTASRTGHNISSNTLVI
jgi:hypothetical protein